MFFYTVFLLLLPLTINACLTGCKCTQTHLICTCPDTNELHLIPYELKPRPNQVHITGCQTVHLYLWNSVFREPLHILNISQVDNLHIDPQTFERVSNMHQLLISHTHIRSWDADSFGGIHHIRRIGFFDVTADEVPSYVFRDLQNVKELSIVNCTFKTIQQHAISNISNLSQLSIINSSIGTFVADSVGLTDMNNFVLSHTEVDHMLQGSLVLSNVDKVLIKHNGISFLHPQFFTAVNITAMSFQHNRIGIVYSGAFIGLQDVPHLEFVHNMFSETFNESFTLLDPSMGKVYFDGNRFVCSKDLCWMLDAAQENELYRGITHNSTCLAPDYMQGKRVSDMSSYADDVDVCGEEMTEASGFLPTEDRSQTTLDVVTMSPNVSGVVSGKAGRIETGFFTFVIIVLSLGLN